MTDGFKLVLETNNTADSTLDIHVWGTLEIANSVQFRDQAIEMAEGNPGARRVRFILEGLTYISSSGIGAFVEIMTELKKRSVEIVLTRVPSHVKKVIDLLGFGPFLNME